MVLSFQFLETTLTSVSKAFEAQKKEKGGFEMDKKFLEKALIIGLGAAGASWLLPMIPVVGTWVAMPYLGAGLGAAVGFIVVDFLGLFK